MNTITRITPLISYPEVDAAKLNSAAGEASKRCIDVKQLFTQTRYLPTLHERVSEVGNVIRNGQFALREATQNLDIKLGSQVKALKSFHTELDGASDADREEILEDIAHRVSNIFSIVSDHHATLSNLLNPMKAPVDRASTGDFLIQLNAEAERYPEEIQQMEQRRQNLETKRQALTQAMATIEAKGFSQLTKETAITTQKLAEAGMASPEIAAVQGAIELAQEVLERVESLINYMDMANARDTIRARLDQLLSEIQSKQSALTDVKRRTNLINASHSFDDQRMFYISEFEKFIDAPALFLSTYRGIDTDNPDAIAPLAADALALGKRVNVLA